MAEDDFIALQEEPIAVEAVFARLASADPTACGGVCVFEGRTRQEVHPDYGPLVALAYEAYASMALMQMRRLVQTARERWPIAKLVLVHRVGQVAVGAPSVIIAVVCAHREEAFAACRWLIDTLKQEVPIWKKEIWASGESSWVDPTTQDGSM